MGKVKAAKVEAGEAVREEENVALVVFGRDEGGRPHASTFIAADSQLAERAAAIMGMLVLPISTDKHRQIAAELPAGRVFESGKAFTPFTTEARYARLEAFGEAFQPGLPPTSAPPAHSSVPSDWKAVEVGALVLASEGPSRGFFEAVVLEEPGDGLYIVQWRDWPDVLPFPRRREHLALLTPELSTLADQLDELPSEADGAPASGSAPEGSV